MERRLAAVLVADVVGYSRLMETDEVGTLKALKAMLRDVFDAKIAEHHGRLVKLMGDGVLVEFASVVQAVKCAMEIQRGVAERNAGLPQDRCVQFRIGINLGDIIAEDDDIYGGGVNVAARLEAYPSRVASARGDCGQFRYPRLQRKQTPAVDRCRRRIVRGDRIWYSSTTLNQS